MKWQIEQIAHFGISSVETKERFDQKTEPLFCIDKKPLIGFTGKEYLIRNIQKSEEKSRYRFLTALNKALKMRNITTVMKTLAAAALIFFLNCAHEYILIFKKLRLHF